MALVGYVALVVACLWFDDFVLGLRLGGMDVVVELSWFKYWCLCCNWFVRFPLGGLLLCVLVC